MILTNYKFQGEADFCSGKQHPQAETVLLLKLAIYKLPLAESKASPLGVLPISIVPITLFFWPDIAVTVLSPELVTYKLPLAESKATSYGFLPTVIGLSTTVFFLPDITQQCCYKN